MGSIDCQYPRSYFWKMKRPVLTKEEKENRVYDEMTFFVEKTEKKYKVRINYNIEVEHL